MVMGFPHTPLCPTLDPSARTQAQQDPDHGLSGPPPSLPDVDVAATPASSNQSLLARLQSQSSAALAAPQNQCWHDSTEWLPQGWAYPYTLCRSLIARVYG